MCFKMYDKLELNYVHQNHSIIGYFSKTCVVELDLLTFHHLNKFIDGARNL